MKLEHDYNYSIETLTIYKDSPFSALEYFYLKALEYTINCFEKTDKNNTLSLYLDKNTFLIANHDDKEKINPIAFVNEKGEILFNVPINVFKKAISEFDKYIAYSQNSSKRQDMSYNQQIQEAIRDYKNDLLDFYINNNLLISNVIEKARNQYENYLER